MVTNISFELADRIKRGDLAAFEQMLYVYEKPIFGYLFSLSGNKDDAQDMTQEVFIKVYKNLSSIDPQSNFKNWLYKIATNTFYDWCRAKKRKPLTLIEENEYDFETNNEDNTYLSVEENIDNSIDLELALEKIKPIYKTIILLYYYQGLSYEEITAVLKAPLNTIKTHLR